MLVMSFSRGFAQWTESSDINAIDSLIFLSHQYAGPGIVRMDTIYSSSDLRMEEHYFINIANNVLERAVVQIYHSPSASTLEYYFFLNNKLARVQTQEMKDDVISNTRIHYFAGGKPIECSRKDRTTCTLYVQKAKRMIQGLKLSPIWPFNSLPVLLIYNHSCRGCSRQDRLRWVIFT